MKPDKNIIEDLTKIAGGAVSVASGFREQIRNDVKARVEEFFTKMDLVPREDFDRIEILVHHLKTENEDLKKRISSLEKQAKPAKPPTRKTPTKTSAKTTPKTTRKTTQKK